MSSIYLPAPNNWNTSPRCVSQLGQGSFFFSSVLPFPAILTTGVSVGWTFSVFPVNAFVVLGSNQKAFDTLVTVQFFGHVESKHTHTHTAFDGRTEKCWRCVFGMNSFSVPRKDTLSGWTEDGTDWRSVHSFSYSTCALRTFWILYYPVGPVVWLGEYTVLFFLFLLFLLLLFR